MLPPLTPQERKARTFGALLAQLEGLARRNPVLLVLEDAHWCDPTTLELFDRIVECVVSLPVLLVVIFRPEFDLPWAARHAQITSLVLNRLGRAEARAIADRVAGGRALRRPARRHCRAHRRRAAVPRGADQGGARGGAAAGRGRLLRPAGAPAAPGDPGHAARLAPGPPRPPRSREEGQVAACIGREFDYGLLAAVAPLSKDELEEALAELAKAEPIFRRGVPPEATYTFKHALVRDTAYESLPVAAPGAARAHRRDPGETTAGDGDVQPELLAHHYTEAGLAEQAIRYWQRA